jgi:hypothetical protein
MQQLHRLTGWMKVVDGNEVFDPGEVRYLGTQRSAPFRFWEELGALTKLTPPPSQRAASTEVARRLPKAASRTGAALLGRWFLAHTGAGIGKHRARYRHTPGSVSTHTGVGIDALRARYRHTPGWVSAHTGVGVGTLRAGNGAFPGS